MYMHSEVNKHECDKCNAKFVRKDNLTRHQAENHSKLKLNWNMIQFREDPLFQCDKCEKGFKRKHTLSIHKKLKHMELGSTEVRNVCCFCTKEFATKSNCTRHQKQCEAKVVFQMEPDEN